MLVADAYPVVREGLKHMLSDAPAVEVVGEAATVAALHAALHELPCDVLVMTPTPLSQDGLVLLDRLHYAHPSLAILTLGRSAKPLYTLRVLQAGADGYLPLTVADRDLLPRAVRTVARGGLALPPEMVGTLVRHLDPRAGAAQPQPLHVKLSPREFQVMHLIAQGRKTGAIADALAISASTVRTHRQRLLCKLGLANNAEVVRYTIEHDLLE